MRRMILTNKEMLCKELGHASFKGDGSILRNGVHNQLAGNDRRVGDIHEGQGKRKKYMGDLRLRLTVIVTTMSRFPSNVTTYIIRNEQLIFSSGLDSL
jgi:hypothetical protein